MVYDPNKARGLSGQVDNWVNTTAQQMPQLSAPVPPVAGPAQVLTNPGARVAPVPSNPVTPPPNPVGAPPALNYVQQLRDWRNIRPQYDPSTMQRADFRTSIQDWRDQRPRFNNMSTRWPGARGY